MSVQSQIIHTHCANSGSKHDGEHDNAEIIRNCSCCNNIRWQKIPPNVQQRLCHRFICLGLPVATNAMNGNLYSEVEYEVQMEQNDPSGLTGK